MGVRARWRCVAALTVCGALPGCESTSERLRAFPLAAAGSLASLATSYPLDDLLRLNHIQCEGTHNSYHVATLPVPRWDYSHPPLNEQLDAGIRSFEFDVHYSGSAFDVHHISLIDGGTTCGSLIECLGVIKAWSDRHPLHHALFIMLEPKRILGLRNFAAHFDRLEAEILSVWGRERLVTPDDVRGQACDLRTAIMTVGWPTLGQTRGKVLFSLDETEDYVDDPSLAGKLFFPHADPSDPFAAIIKQDEAEADENKIRDLVAEGFIVRTRYNDGYQNYDSSRMKAALRSGAHWLSGDFPNNFVFPGETNTSRCNPVSAPPECVNPAIE